SNLHTQPRSYTIFIILPLLCAFFFTDPAPTETYTLSLHDALPISPRPRGRSLWAGIFWQNDAHAYGHRPGPEARRPGGVRRRRRSEEHTSELQSQSNLVCRLLLEKKKQRRSPSDCRSARPLQRTRR